MGLLTTINRIFTWWNGQTIGTQFWTWRKGQKVGEDAGGNVFYQTADGVRRWVIYNGEAEASKVSPDWHGWLHHTWDEPPTKQALPHKSWEKPHQENLTGTAAAYAPAGSIRRQAPAARADYEAMDTGIMRENPAEVAVGALVLAAAAGFLYYTTTIAGIGGLRSEGYDLTASFRSIEGVTAGTDVKLAGVKIGTVSSIVLNPLTFRGDATLSLTQNIDIPDDSAAVIASEGLLGGNFVEIVPGGSLDNFAPGAEIEDTQGAVSLISLLLKFVTGEGDAS